MANSSLFPQATPLESMVSAKAQEPWRENLNVQMICRDCNEVPPNLVEELSSGDVVCGSCGLVLGDRTVDTHSEWRTFSNDDQGNDDPSRVGAGADPLFNGSQLQTGISFGVGSNGRSRKLHRAQNEATQKNGTRGLLAAYKEVGALCEAIGIPENVSDTAKHHFKMVHNARAFRGKSQESIVAGCIFIACRQCKVNRTFHEIFTLTRVPIAEIGKISKALERFFAAQNQAKVEEAEPTNGFFHQEVEPYETTQSTNPKELCARFCSQLNLSFQVTKVSQEIAEKLDRIGTLAGRSPLSVVAACLYLASHFMGQPRSPKDISAVTGLSNGTMRKAYRLIYPEREKLIDPEWLVKGKGGMVGDLVNLPAS